MASETMVRVMHQGDYLVPREQGEQLRERLVGADALPRSERNQVVRKLIAQVKRDGTEAPKGLTPDLVLALVEVTLSDIEQPATQSPPPDDDGTHHYRDPGDYEVDTGGPSTTPTRPPGKAYGETGRDIDPTDPWRG